MSPRPAKAYALKLLAIKAQTERELAEKLQLKGYREDVTREVIEQLKTKGLINDAKYAKDMAEYRLAHGEGPIKIRAELAKRGVSDETIVEALRQAQPEFDELKSALEQAQRHLARLRGVPREAQHRRVVNYLRRHGFAMDTVYRVLSIVRGASNNEPIE